jgi:hypothetical protein
MARKVLFQPPVGGDSAAAVAERPATDAGDVALDATDHNSAPNAVASDASVIDSIVHEEGPAAFSARLREQTLKCAEASIRRLFEIKYLSREDAEGILSSFGYYVKDLPEKSSVLDIAAFLVTIKLESKDEKAVKEIRQITDVLKASLQQKVNHIGFAHLNEMPGQLYQDHDRVFEICSTLMCPVIQASEADFFTITSINPITAATAGALVAQELERATGTRPFTFIMTTDSSAWSFLCEKHFGS